MRQTRRTLKGALLKDLTLTFLFPFLLVLLTIFFYITASVEKETEQKNTIFAAQLSNQMQAALEKKHAYVGMIGSRRHGEIVKESLAAGGMAPELLDELHTPIGLSIGAQTPSEIAVAIMAEIIAVKSSSGSEEGFTKVQVYPSQTSGLVIKGFIPKDNESVFVRDGIISFRLTQENFRDFYNGSSEKIAAVFDVFLVPVLSDDEEISTTALFTVDIFSFAI